MCNCTSAEASSAYRCRVGDSRGRRPGTLLAPWLCQFQGSLVQRGLLLDASILSQFWRAQMRQFPPRRRLLTSALVRSLAHGDLFDHLDNAAPKLGIADARERTGQRQALRGGEKIGNVSRWRTFAEASCARSAARSSLE